MRPSQAVAFGLLGISVMVLLLASPVESFARFMPKGLPRWFKMLDADGDGKISREEWKKGEKPEDEFKALDRDGDGFITKEEIFRRPTSKKPAHRLEFVSGKASLEGEIEMSEDKRFGKRPFKAVSVKFEKGKTYRIEQTAKDYLPLLLLEKPNGEFAGFNGSMAKGQPAVISHAAAEDGVYRILALSQDGIKAGPFWLSVRVHVPGVKELPRWLESIDKDGDGQVSLREWLDGGKKREDFRKHDLDRDGFITPDEAGRATDAPVMAKAGQRLMLKGGKASLEGTVEESATELYQGKKSFRALTVRLERGKTYRIEMVSQVYYAFLYLEAPGGAILAQHDSGGNGLTSLIVHKAESSGEYRIIATSLGGFRTGPFTLTIRTQTGREAAASAASTAGGGGGGLPKWFNKLDTDSDGQVSLREWLDAGKTEVEFREYDMNGDGFITSDELLRHMKNQATTPKM